MKARHKAYDKMGGVKLQILNPVDFARKFNFSQKSGSIQKVGAIEAHLANFGMFQTGTSMTA